MAGAEADDETMRGSRVAGARPVLAHPGARSAIPGPLPCRHRLPFFELQIAVIVQRPDGSRRCSKRSSRGAAGLARPGPRDVTARSPGRQRARGSGSIMSLETRAPHNLPGGARRRRIRLGATSRSCGAAGGALARSRLEAHELCRLVGEGSGVTTYARSRCHPPRCGERTGPVAANGRASYSAAGGLDQSPPGLRRLASAPSLPENPGDAAPPDQ